MPPDLQDFLFEHFQQSYQFQLEQIEKLRDRISFLMTFLSIVGSALLFLLTNYSYAWHGLWSLLFYVPAVLAALLFILSAACLLWVLGTNYKYDFIPGNHELQRVSREKAEWAARNGKTPDYALKSIKKSLLARYRDGAQRNFAVNRSRTDCLLLAQRAGVVALVFAFFAVPRYYFDKAKEDDKPAKVLLVAEPQK